MPGLIASPGMIRLAVEPVDMRRDIDGLSMEVIQSREHAPCAGSTFVFCYRANNRFQDIAVGRYRRKVVSELFALR